jgi:phenylacetate-CoA ligase
MKLLEHARNKSFWLLDFLKGSPIRKHLIDITYVNENYNSTKSLELRKQALENLLDHTSYTVPFYHKYKGITQLDQFPVINKLQIKEDYNAFTSTDPKLKRKHKVATSGSTGIPFKLYQDHQKRYRNIADTIYFARKADVSLGMKVFFLRVWTRINKKNPLTAWMQNVKMQDIANFNDREITKFLNVLAKNKFKKGIWAYASSLDNIATYLDKGAYTIPKVNIASMVACSEYLNDKTKSIIETHLKTPVISRYSNAENGIFAQQKFYSNTNFDINWASYYFEILKFDEDTPASPGELGRVVITDLFNYYIPIIRYDIGDVGSIILDEENKPVFAHIEGRKQDLIYNTQGELLSSYIVSKVINHFNQITQYQFVQEGEKDYLLNININDPFNNEEELIQSVKNYVGEDGKVKVAYVEEVPLLASGKRQRVVNNYTKKESVEIENV